MSSLVGLKLSTLPENEKQTVLCVRRAFESLVCERDFPTKAFKSLYIKRGKVSVTYVRNGGRGQLSSE